MQPFTQVPRKTKLNTKKKTTNNHAFKQGSQPGKDQQATFENRLIYP